MSLVSSAVNIPALVVAAAAFVRVRVCTTAVTTTAATTETTTTEGPTTTETTTTGTTMTQSTTVPLTEIVRECDDQDLCDYEGSSEPGDGDDEMVKTRISALYHNLICQFFTRS